jgi:hypothetical protein
MEIIMQQAEQSVEGKEWIAKHNQAVEAIYVLKRKGLIDNEVVDTIENITWLYGSVCAETFFEWGLKIGRDPSIVLELPDTPSAMDV